MAQRGALLGILKSKITFITSQKDELHGLLEAYIDKETAEAVTAVDVDEQNLNTIRLMNSRLDVILDFVLAKCAEMEDIMQGITAQISEPATTAECSSLSEQPKATSSSLQSYHGSESSDISQLYHRIGALELAINTCHSEAQQGTSQQRETDDKLEELKTKLETVITDDAEAAKRQTTLFERIETRLDCVEGQLKQMAIDNSKTVDLTNRTVTKVEDMIKEREVKVSTRLEELDIKFSADVEQKMNQLEERYINTESKYATKFEDFEKQLGYITLKSDDALKDSAAKLDSVEKRTKKLEVGEKKNASCLEELSKKVEALKSQYNDYKRQQSAKFQSLERETETLSGQFSYLKEQTKHVQGLRESTAKLFSRMDTLAKKSDLPEIMKTTRTVERSVEKLSFRIHAAEQSVKDVLLFREKEESKRKETEDRITAVEAKRRQDLNRQIKKLEEITSLYKQVCHIVDTRVTPLSRLLRNLNNLHKNVEKREEMAVRLDRITEEVNDMSEELLNLKVTSHKMEAKSQQMPVGFTAYISGLQAPKTSRERIYTGFKNVTFNVRDQYSPDTGEFLAPWDGLYVTSLTLRQSLKGHVEAEVRHQWIDEFHQKHETAVCTSCTGMDRASSCGLGVVWLKAGDKLLVKMLSRSEQAILNHFSSFSCFLIN